RGPARRPRRMRSSVPARITSGARDRGQHARRLATGTKAPFLVHTFLYLIVVPSLVSSISPPVTLTLPFVVVPLTVHSSSSSPLILYVPWNVFPITVIFAVASLPNSAVILASPSPASHLPTMRSWALEPQADTNRATQAAITIPNFVFMVFS